jgi:tellurite resistance protein
MSTLNAQDQVLLKTLVALAWADGEIDAGETEWLEKVFDSLGLSSAERDLIVAVPQALPSKEEFATVLTEEEDRLFLLRVLITMAMSDGTVAVEELDMLKEVSARLGVSDSKLEELRVHTVA